MTSHKDWSVVDLFSGGGGASYGFAKRRGFVVRGAADLEVGKPSSGIGATGCNATYLSNIGIAPLNRDLMELAPSAFADHFQITAGSLDVMISCAPCTDFTRTKPTNHQVDSSKNGLVGRSADFVDALRPKIVVMENARELVKGRFAHHHSHFCDRLRSMGYDVSTEVVYLSSFGLPQIRERAIIIASRIGPARGLQDLWGGVSVNRSSLTVRSALLRLAELQRGAPKDYSGEVFSGMNADVSARLSATPHDGGSWIDLARNPETKKLLTPALQKRSASGHVGSHPDVYGRMWWDRPAPTIKRECAHVGNGRYAHPTLDRLLTVREMSFLQGFPFDYQFPATSISNRYRNLGDAVPPMISYQISAIAQWMLTGIKPVPHDWVLPGISLQSRDLIDPHIASTEAAA